MKIFILSCGTTACYNFAKTLKSRNLKDVYLIGVDLNKPELVATTNYLDEFYTVPPSSDKSYYDTILDLLDLTLPDYIIPSFDADQKLFFDGNDDLKKKKIKSLGIPEDTLKFYHDKLIMTEEMNKYRLPTPKVYKEALSQVNTYFAKPVNGVGSVGATIISASQFYEFDKKGYLIQELCHGPEITVQCFRTNDIFRCICRERIQTKAGVCSKTRIFFDNELSNIAKSFSEIINTPIIFNLQFMKNSDNNWVITDVNLRMAGGGYLSKAVGWDEPSALISYLKNEKAEKIEQYLPTVNGETYVIATTSWEITKSNYRP